MRTPLFSRFLLTAIAIVFVAERVIAASAASPPARAWWMKEARWGVMTHFLADWRERTDGEPRSVEQWNKLIDGFEVDAVAGETWGRGAPRFTTEQAIAFSRQVAEVGSAVTWDTPAQKNGTFSAEYLTQLRAIGEAVMATKIKPAEPAR